MATSRDREERGRVQQPSNRRNRLPDLISVTMSDGSLVEINLTGANREEREDVARFLDAHTTVAMAPPAAHRESRERSPRLVSSSGPTLRVTSPDVQDRIGQLPSPPIASHGESASDERMPLERAGAASFAQLRPQRCDGAPMSKASAVMAHPCQRHQRWPQKLGHCLCPLLQRNLRLNSVARRRRDSSPREKRWFDAMCEEPFDAVAKVVVHSCGKLNVVLSVFVALTTNSIYIAVLLRPGTFPFWYRHRAYDLRAGAVFFVGHRLKSS